MLAWQLASSMVAGKLHFKLWEGGKESKFGMVWIFKLSKSTSRYILPPIRPCLPNLSKQFHQWRVSIQMPGTPGAPSHSKHSILFCFLAFIVLGPSHNVKYSAVLKVFKCLRLPRHHLIQTTTLCFLVPIELWPFHNAKCIEFNFATPHSHSQS